MIFNKKIEQVEKEVYDYSLCMPRIVCNLNISDHLIAILDKKVDLLLCKAHFWKNKIKNDILNLCEDKVSNIVELEHCHKGKERLLEKAYISLNNGDDLEVAIDKIEDVLRFTIVINNENDYLRKTQEYLRKLEVLGYEVYDFLNFWGGEYYQGFNVLLMHHSLKFEVQFHTINSYYIKEGFTRIPYMVARNPLACDEMKKKANLLRKYYQSMVIVPEGAKDFQYKKKYGSI